MANTILGSGSAGYQYGVETDETGLNIEKFSCRYFPEFDDKLPGKDGVTQMRCRPSKFSREISIAGEVKGSTGLMALTLIAAATVANDIATFGDGTGLVILDEVTEDQDRKGWRRADFKLSSSPGLTSAT
jgi:hypothetical protein